MHFVAFCNQIRFLWLEPPPFFKHRSQVPQPTRKSDHSGMARGLNRWRSGIEPATLRIRRDDVCGFEMRGTATGPKNNTQTGFRFRKHVASVRSNPSYGSLEQGASARHDHMTVHSRNHTATTYGLVNRDKQKIVLIYKFLVPALG